MADATILKNKNLTVKVSFTDKESPKLGEGFLTFSELEIINNGICKRYKRDKDNFAQEEGNENTVEPRISLTDFAQNEKRSFYRHLLQSKYNEIENIVILSGSGTSVGIGVANKGLTMSGLWDKLNEIESDCLKTLIKLTEYANLDEDENIIETGIVKDLEALLTIAGMKNIVSPDENLAAAIKKAREFIVKACSLDLPENAPHLEFLHKITLRPQKYPRVKVFTLNYDTLFEQAAGKEKYTVIDGFTFSSPRIFNGKYFDYDIIETKHNRQDKKDNTISKLFYLYKMHGSINWIKSDSEIEQVDNKKINVDDRVMIFPQYNKYEHSYEQPYFEMMARFQQALRTENSLLITIGFSFLDKHISSVILDSIKQNPSLNLMAFTFPEIVLGNDKGKEYQQELHKMSEIQSRITFIAEAFEDLAMYPNGQPPLGFKSNER